MDELNSLPIEKKAPKGRIITSAIFGTISIILFVLYSIIGSSTIDLKTTEVEGLEGIGVAVGLIIVVVIMLIGLVLVNIFDIVCLVISIILLVRERKTKSKTKIYAIVSTSISSIILVASWIVLAIFFIVNQ